MNMSKHAQERYQQRGFQKGYVDFIVEYGTPSARPGNVYEYKISKKQKNLLIRDLKRLIQMVEKCDKKAVLLEEKTATVISVYNILN